MIIDVLLSPGDNLGIISLMLLLVLLGLAALVFIAGLLLYRFIVYPQTRVTGTLTYARAAGEFSLSPDASSFQLSRLRKNPVLISFAEEHNNADLCLKGSAYSHDLIFKAIWSNSSPRFLQGWKALFDKYLPIRIFVKCTPPGIIDHNGDIYTEKELFHADEFESGDYFFKYDNPYGKWFKEKSEHGVDVIEEKVKQSQ